MNRRHDGRSGVSFHGFDREIRMSAEWHACLDRVLEAGAIESYGSPFVVELEERLAAYLGRRHVVALGSGTDALDLALQALDLPAGGEVLVPALTFQATAAAVVKAGLVPRFVDIDPLHLQMDVGAADAALGARTAAILPVHLYGIPCPIHELRALAHRAGVPLVEDVAQAVGARSRGVRAGALGDVACFSCGPTKLLSALGEAGFLATDDERVATRTRKLRNNGSPGGFQHELLGRNAALDSLQAAFLLRRLDLVDDLVERNRASARLYVDALRDEPRLRCVVAREGDTWAPSKFVLLVPEEARTDLAAALATRGVPTAIHYPEPLHRQPCFAPAPAVSLPVTEAACRRVLSLPLHPYLTADEVRFVSAAVGDAFGSLAS